MDFRKIYVALAAVFLVFFLAGLYIAPASSLAAPPVETPSPLGQPPEEQTAPQLTPAPDVEAAIRSAFESAAQQNQSLVPAFIIYDVIIDHIQISQDGTTALIWLALRDQETGEVVASEPGLSIANNANQAVSALPSSWSVTLPPEAVLAEQIQALPQDLLTADIRNMYLSSSAEIITAGAQVFSGYKLPWTAGVARRVTNSIGHVVPVSGGLTSCAATCRYAFDFADGTMFPLLAAKGGTIRAYKTSCSNGDSNCTNYLVLEDQSTIPTTYQLYYHMAYNSVPDRLRAIGTPVRQGEYIGDVDDTGASSGHHLHFHVYTTPTQTNWSWGASQDITFDDVSDNGGRPRTCAEARERPDLGSECTSGNAYISGNTPANPPFGSLDLPVNRQMVTSRSLLLQGVAQDDIQIKRIQVLANYDGTWKTIDDIPPVSGTYAREIDLCSAGIPNGPFALSVRIYDREGTLAANMPVLQLVNAASCRGVAEPPPAISCTPASNQIALYSEPDYRGTCAKFTTGTNYSASMLGAVGSDGAASIQVGSGVRAVLYDRGEDVSASQPKGRIETLEKNDASLADNRIGILAVSGVRVISRTSPPNAPVFNSPVGSNTAPGTNPTSMDSLALAWEGAAGATAFDVKLSSTNSSPAINLTSTLANASSFSVGTLPVGDYRFSVTARSSAGTNVTEQTFSVTDAAFAAGDKLPVPFEDDIEKGLNGWTASGLWRRDVTDGDYAWISNRNGTNYNDPTWKAGDLTSPVLLLPAGQAQYLRFDYFMKTEDGNPYWDQRRVQISANGGRFVDLFQLSDDKQDGQIWLNSGPISLVDYAGQEIRLRFHFDAIDEDYNSGSGWIIDNILVNNQAPDMGCVDGDDTPAAASTIAIGTIGLGMICPERDVDFYKFTVDAGQPVIVDIDARMRSPSSSLDSMVFLLDADGRSVIAQNDDEQLGVMQDSWLSYIVGRTGTYYLKIKPWDYPGSGSRDHFYQLSLRDDLPVSPREVRFTYPLDGVAPLQPFEINLSAVDFDGGPVAQVDFFWHGPDWNKAWVKLGSDSNGSDGWGQMVNPAAYGGVAGSALVALAHSRTGGLAGTVFWDLQPDVTVPNTAMKALPETIQSTVFQLSWTATDARNDIVAFDLQVQSNNGSGWSGWQDWGAGELPGYLRKAWFAGTQGGSYRFRIRARDRAGNVEPFRNVPDAAASLERACTPDTREGQDNSIASPVVIANEKESPQFNLCRSNQAGAGGGDVDWFSFTAQQGDEMSVLIMPRGGSAAFSISLYKDTNNRIGTWEAHNYGESVSARWTAPETRTYYLSVQPMRSEMSGTEMLYQVWVGLGNWQMLPAIFR